MTDRSKQIRGRFARTLVASGVLLLALVGSARAASPQVTVLTATGVVDNVMSGYLHDGIAAAERDGVSAVVIELDTPGGSLGAMLDITTAMLESTVPVIVWVAPAGGWAASAGTFITLAGNLAYMAPGTSIGAASPVDSSGADIPGTEGEKVMNISISTITSIAQTRGRDPSWPVSAVRDAKAASAAEAVQLHVVDGIADTLDSVLGQADGHEVTTKAGTVTLALAGATVTAAPMNPVEDLMHLLADPNIAFVLFVLGLAGLVIELFHPTILAGIAGVLALILSFVGFGSLPLNLAGLLLVGFGMALFALETQLTSHGLLGLGGVVAFVLGASILYSPGPGDTENLVHVATPVIVVTAAAMLAFVVAIAWAARRIRRMAPPRDTVGNPLAVGTPGIVQMPLAPLGTVHLGGETWSARTVDGRELDRNTAVSLVRFDRLVAVVAPVGQPPVGMRQPGITTPPASAIPPTVR